MNYWLFGAAGTEAPEEPPAAPVAVVAGAPLPAPSTRTVLSIGTVDANWRGLFGVAGTALAAAAGRPLGGRSRPDPVPPSPADRAA